MSLHIGNLSSRTRRDDLERVFRRFGRCTIQVKDKYGFVVYDYPASAEKALKTLRGTRICGEAITLSWSKQQPRAPQRSARGGKSYEPPRRRYYVRENADRRLGRIDRRDYEMDSKKADGEVGKPGSSDLVDESNSHRPNDSNIYVGESERISPNDRKNHLEDDRWWEQVVDPTSGNYLENGMEFDRYEPQHISPLAGSQERTGNSYNRMSEKNSRERLRPSRHAIRLRSRESDKEPSTSRNRRRSMGRGDSSKKRNRRDYGSRDINRLEGAKGPSSSSIHSDYTSSRSQSLSGPLRPLSRSPSPSKLKSVPSKKISQSSPSCYSGTKTFNSRSTSRSMSPNSSLLPVELIRQKDSKDSVENSVSLVHSKDLSEEETLVRSATGTFKSENITSAVENEFETKPAKLEQEDMKKDLSENDNSLELLESYVPQSNGDGHIIDNLCLHSVEEMSDSQKDDFVGERLSAPECNVSIRSNASNSAKMSSEEMYMVLKHYGLQCPDAKEKDLSVEAYFGSARLWPWDMVYYRRFKKGPISAENYSRRVAQNEEFGIVDKYIRSSSGWGELN